MEPWRIPGAVLVLAVLLGACGDRRPEPIDRPGDIPQAPVRATPVTIVATDFAFEMPDTVPAGVVT